MPHDRQRWNRGTFFCLIRNRICNLFLVIEKEDQLRMAVLGHRYVTTSEHTRHSVCRVPFSTTEKLECFKCLGQNRLIENDPSTRGWNLKFLHLLNIYTLNMFVICYIYSAADEWTGWEGMRESRSVRHECCCCWPAMQNKCIRRATKYSVSPFYFPLIYH